MLSRLSKVFFHYLRNHDGCANAGIVNQKVKLVGRPIDFKCCGEFIDETIE